MRKLIAAVVIAVGLIARVTAQEVPILGITHWEIEEGFQDYGLDLEWRSLEDQRFAGGDAVLYYGPRAGMLVVLEYERRDMIFRGPGIVRGNLATAVSVVGFPTISGKASSYRGQKIGQAMWSVLHTVFCGELSDDLSWAIDRLASGDRDRHTGRCEGAWVGIERSEERSTIEIVYTLSLEVGRTVWVFTVEPAELHDHDNSPAHTIRKMVNQDDELLLLRDIRD